MVKIGDKVRFLNTTGGGMVKAFHGKNMVMVEDESGFDFPVFIDECVVVSPHPRPLSEREGGKKKDDLFLNSQLSALNSQPPTPNPQPPTLNSTKETPQGERLNINLAYLPIDRKAITQSGYEAWFINDSNYFVYFTYLSRQNNSWTNRYHGLIEPNTKIFMEEFGKALLNELEHICIQMIAFKKDKPFGLKNALSVELRLDTVKFYKAHCFTDNDFFDEDALICTVVQYDIPEKQQSR
jgi:hypothetical protein